MALECHRAMPPLERARNFPPHICNPQIVPITYFIFSSMSASLVARPLCPAEVALPPGLGDERRVFDDYVVRQPLEHVVHRQRRHGRSHHGLHLDPRLVRHPHGAVHLDHLRTRPPRGQGRRGMLASMLYYCCRPHLKALSTHCCRGLTASAGWETLLCPRYNRLCVSPIVHQPTHHAANKRARQPVSRKEKSKNYNPSAQRLA